MSPTDPIATATATLLEALVIRAATTGGNPTPATITMTETEAAMAKETGLSRRVMIDGRWLCN